MPQWVGGPTRSCSLIQGLGLLTFALKLFSLIALTSEKPHKVGMRVANQLEIVKSLNLCLPRELISHLWTLKTIIYTLINLTKD